MSLRETINALFAECKAEYGRLPHEQGKVAPDEYTDAAFNAFREAMLSDEVEASAARAYRKRTTGTEDGWAQEAWPISDALTAALDVAMNGGEE